ncbi:hypothetical protein [Xenorhabdus sp. PB62.4]|nr:hypothetical protein [Xenorhabdus sp. PB62.4]MBC8954975.1 hypothetical protein [Xenorhabdus sp. PB62.4]
MQQTEEIAEKIISGLFVDSETPMELFGINWPQAECLALHIENQPIGETD